MTLSTFLLIPAVPINSSKNRRKQSLREWTQFSRGSLPSISLTLATTWTMVKSKRIYTATSMMLRTQPVVLNRANKKAWTYLEWRLSWTTLWTMILPNRKTLRTKSSKMKEKNFPYTNYTRTIGSWSLLLPTRRSSSSKYWTCHLRAKLLLAKILETRTRRMVPKTMKKKKM